MSILATFTQNLNEDVLQDLKQIVSDNQHKKIRFEDGAIDVDGLTANMLLTVFAALKKEEAKNKFKRMISQSTTSFMKVVDFGWKQTR